MSNAALVVEGLSVWCKTRTGLQQLVDNISFSIDAGQAVGLVGESGCGKTMTALAILGLLPNSGMKVKVSRIQIDGQDVVALNNTQMRAILGRKIAMVFQQPATALDPVFTLGQQIASVYRRHISGNRDDIRKAVLDSLSQVGFENPGSIAASYPHQISGGMRQLSMIAMATVCKPAVLIADEPTTALDSATRALILHQIKRLQSDFNMSLLLISHDLSVIRQICDDVMVMYCGRIIEKAECRHLFTQAAHPYSAGLIACIPSVTNNRQAGIRAIPGQVPTPSALPAGCHFAPRCERVDKHCEQTVPELETVSNRSVACFRPLK